MKRLLLIIGLSTNLSCRNKKKPDLKYVDGQLKIYDNIPTELLRDHFYNLYLGREVDRLGDKYMYRRGKPDTANHDLEKEKLRGELYFRSRVVLRSAVVESSART